MTPQPAAPKVPQGQVAKAAKEYPYQDGETIVLGPEIFASVDEEVVAWKGQNYEKQKPKAETARQKLDVDIKLLGSDDWNKVADDAVAEILKEMDGPDASIKPVIELAMKKGVRLAAGLNV